MSSIAYCPICGTDIKTIGKCPNCGYEKNKDYEVFPTLCNIPVDLKSNDQKRKERQKLTTVERKANIKNMIYPVDAKQMIGISFGWDCISVSYPSNQEIITTKLYKEERKYSNMSTSTKESPLYSEDCLRR